MAKILLIQNLLSLETPAWDIELSDKKSISPKCHKNWLMRWLTWGESNEEKPSKAVKSRQKPSKSRQKPSDGFWRNATAFDDCTPGGRFFQFLIWPIMTNFVVKNFVIYININNMDREDPESRIRYLAIWLCGFFQHNVQGEEVIRYEIWQWDWWTFPPNHPSPKTMKKKGTKKQCPPDQKLDLSACKILQSIASGAYTVTGTQFEGVTETWCQVFSHSGRCSHAHLTRRWESRRQEGNQRV